MTCGRCVAGIHTERVIAKSTERSIWLSRHICEVSDTSGEFEIIALNSISHVTYSNSSLAIAP